MNFGHSSRLGYDEDAYSDRSDESAAVLRHVLSPDQMYNCSGCLSVDGPRSGPMGRSVRMYKKGRNGPATSQELVDVETVLSNRNVRISKAKRSGVNPINPEDYESVDASYCDRYLDTDYSRIMNPPSSYRNMSINRFYPLIRNPQDNIFWDFASNTTLEAKDNFRPTAPVPWPDLAGPKELPSEPQSCSYSCPERRCPTAWRKK